MEIVVKRTDMTQTTASKCDDPCGDILQLRKDLNSLIIVTDKLSLAVEKIANHPALQQQPQPPAPGK